MDNFNDASIFWSWNESHTDLQRVITEAGGVLNISVDALENAVWTNATNNAPRLLTGVPGFPCFIETKITAWGTSGGIDNGGGIVFSRQDGTGTAAMIYLTLMRTGAVTQLIAGYGGGLFGRSHHLRQDCHYGYEFAYRPMADKTKTSIFIIQQTERHGRK